MTKVAPAREAANRDPVGVRARVISSVDGIRRNIALDPEPEPPLDDRVEPGGHDLDRWSYFPVRKGLELAYLEFRLRFRQAAEDLKLGRAEVEFPPGCFPPRLPFARGRPIASLWSRQTLQDPDRAHPGAARGGAFGSLGGER